MAKIACLLDDDFEDSEFRIPCEMLRHAGHDVQVLGKKAGTQLHGKREQETVTIDANVKDSDPDDYDALLIPGGYSPDKLRINKDAVAFTRNFFESGKPVAAVCHGPQLLIEAEVVEGKTLTSWSSVRKDLENARANWVDQEVVQDGSLITSRKPEDLKAFSTALLRQL